MNTMSFDTAARRFAQPFRLVIVVVSAVLLTSTATLRHPLVAADDETAAPQQPLVRADCGAYDCFSTHTILNEYTNSQPGLTAHNGQLLLVWAGTNGSFNSMVSYDGITWSGKVSTSAWPRVLTGYSGGISATSAAAQCGYAYAAWTDTSGNVWGARCWACGSGWEGPNLIVGGLARSAPCLRGDDPTLPIGFAFTRTQFQQTTKPYEAWKGKFGCLFDNVTYPLQSCFFNRSCSFSWGQDDPTIPAWTGTGGNELSAIAQGFTQPDIQGQLIYEATPDWPYAAGNAWSNNGVAGIIHPTTGQPYVIWTCHKDGPDDCAVNDGRGGCINFWVPDHSGWGTHIRCSGWSAYNPSATFFQGGVWLAWVGGDGKINVGRVQNVPGLQ